jgi:hypothetical protein
VAIGSLYWAVILLVYDEFERPVYADMRDLMPENTWGLCFLVVGIVQFWRAVHGVPVSSGWVACIAAAVTSALWCYVAWSLHFSLAPPAAGNAGNVVLALLSCGILVRAVARRD